MRTGESAALAHRLAPSLVPTREAPERAITVDQTNASVVVADAAIVKWLQPPMPEPHRSVTLASHLRSVDFTETPAFFGAEVIDGTVVATVSAYLPGSQDGWEWYVDQLTGELVGGTSVEATRVAGRLGALAGRLHRALARPSRHLPQPTGRVDAAGEHRRGLAVLATALEHSEGRAADILRARADRICEALEPMAALGPVDAQHIHGDLHVGQILRAGDTIVVTDFDGNPLYAPADGAAADGPAAAAADPAATLRSPMVDLASLVQSVDHVGRIVTKRNPALADVVDVFIEAATSATIDGYAEVAPVDPQLLDGLRVVQELHELVYAATHLPRWSYVPEAALTALFP